MSVLTGPYKELQAAAAPVAAATWYAATNTIIGVRGSNTLRLYVGGTVASLGDVDFYLTHVYPGDTTATAYTRASAGDGPEIFGPIPFSATGQNFFIDIPIGIPLETVQVYYRVGSVTTSPKISIKGLCYLDESGTSNAEISVGDIEVEISNITHAEDVAHVSGDVGVQTLAVRNDVLAALAGTDGDYAPLQVDAVGAVFVDKSRVGTAAWALGTGAMAASECVNLATDDTQFGAVGAAADADGNIHGQLRYIGEAVDGLTAAPVVDEATGAAGIAKSTTNSAAFELHSVTVLFSAAPTTSENLTITLNANDDPGAQEYDAVIFSNDPSATSATSVVFVPDRPIMFESGDELDVAYTNTDTRTYGLRIVTRLI